MRIGSGWKCLKIVSNVGLDMGGIESTDYANTMSYWLIYIMH